MASLSGIIVYWYSVSLFHFNALNSFSLSSLSSYILIVLIFLFSCAAVVDETTFVMTDVVVILMD